MKKLFFVCTYLFLFSQTSYSRRSIHRPHDPRMPQITTQWINKKTSPMYFLKSYYLELWPLEITRYLHEPYRTQFAMPNILSYRYQSNKTIDSEILKNDIAKLVDCLYFLKRKQKKREFKNFVVLKDRDFNYKKHSGLLVLKHKQYPFVVKLYMENPQSFTKPFTKGIEPCFFFTMAGGMNRYLSGITRIPNLHEINRIIKQNPYWSDKITTPRKWLFIPQNSRWFTVTTKNMGKPLSKSYKLPSVYTVICDSIAIEREFSISKSKDRHTAMQLTKFIGNRIDPNICNFLYEKKSKMIALIDTEHFASQVGLRRPLNFTRYSSWYLKLGNKCLRNSSLCNKKERRELQNTPFADILQIDPITET